MIVSREVERNEKVVAKNFCVATQDIPVATRTRLLDQNFVMTLSKFIATESKKSLREQVVIDNYRLRQKPTTNTKGSVMTEFSMSRQSGQIGLEIWGSITPS